MRRENIGRFLKCLSFGLQRPKDLLGLVFTFEDEMFRRKVVEEHNCHEGLPVVNLLDLFPSFSAEVSPYAFLDGGSMVSDIALLRSLAGRVSPCTVLEIGTWRGETIANLAEVADRCISVSLADEDLRALGWSEDVLRVGRFFSRNRPNILHLEANSRTFDFSPYAGSVDLVFVDGDHSYEGVRSDTLNAFKLLRNDRSMIVWHDCCVSPEGKPQWPVVAGILDGSPREKRSSIYRVSNTCCALYVEGSFPTGRAKFPSVPDKSFTLKVEAHRLPPERTSERP